MTPCDGEVAPACAYLLAARRRTTELKTEVVVPRCWDDDADMYSGVLTAVWVAQYPARGLAG